MTKHKLTILVLSILLLTSISCRKNDTTLTTTGKTALNISADISNFGESGITLNSRSLSLEPSSLDKTVVDTFINLNTGYYLNAQLVPSDEGTAISAARSSVKALSASSLADNIYYKLIVYKTSDGSFVTERLYQRTKESSAVPLLLDGGQHYTIIGISLNSTNSNDLSQSFASTTLATAKFSALNDPDFLFYKEDVLITGEPAQNLSVTFKHKFSQVTTIVDARATGYEVATGSTSMQLRTSKNTAEISFSSETITRSGSTKSTSLSFPSVTAADPTYVSTNPQVFNAVSGDNSLVISQLTIGSIVESNKQIVLNATLNPGYKYNLILSIVPEDKILTHQGYPAVRINGLIWMRHNLAADYSLDPDQTPSVPGLVGGYYQWGRPTKVADYLTPVGPIAGWDVSNATVPMESWNSGTEANPIKTANDPCPTGYRVPTLLEIQSLVNSTEKSSFQGSSPENYTNVKFFTSKRNKNAKLTLPLASTRSPSDGSFVDNLGGSFGYIWTSHAFINSVTTPVAYSASVLLFTPASDLSYGSGPSRASGLNVRCIAVNSIVN